MTHSYRKTPIKGNADTSDKQSKQKANRKYRKVVHQIIDEIKKDSEAYDPVLPDPLEISNNLDFDKDGKNYIENPTRADFYALGLSSFIDINGSNYFKYIGIEYFGQNFSIAESVNKDILQAYHFVKQKRLFCPEINNPRRIGLRPDYAFDASLFGNSL